MPKRADRTTHAVIDGSNLATEGRNEPSLAQLQEAVAAIHDEFDFTNVTVIVDATFEHRVAKSETKAARRAIDANEIITPPAGVIGRGDTFILEVADRAGAVVFSNDSFQEFHGQFGWLFDEGRLVGGKPVPGVGWIYVPRSPVRGPVSRRATSESRRKKKADEPPAKATKASKKRKTTTSTRKSAAKATKARATASTPAASGEGSNDPEAWRTFAADYPVGTTVAATVDRFSSHGAYGSVDGVVIYLPNRLLGDPPPSKARDVLDVGATMDFVVHRFDEERFGVDAGLIPVPGGAKAPAKRAKKATKKTTAKATKKAAAKKATARKATRKSASKTTAKKTASRSTAKKAAKKTTKKATRKSTKKSTARKSTRRTSPPDAG